MKFTYISGQRPLEGYTIKRGIGRGGFGEVYFAVSDGGKEVALKLLRDNTDIELRGVKQCLNLKHSNLVALYDLRTDARGDHWVLMEYMAGEPLSTVLARHPAGLPRELAREWFLALVRAVGYLHDHGIVHRDLKPGNLFIENGMVKVGDVGLSKAMSGTQRTAQTQSIGTVYYMAPEISTGNYTKTIDVYALGIIFYEMLTGRVPFEGESAAEVLMKHLTTPPDLSKLPAPYVPLVSRALAKNPAQRYAGVAEMAHELETITAPKATVVPTASAPRAEVVPPPLPALPVGTCCGRLAELCGSMILSVFFVGLGTTLWAAATKTRELTDAGAVFFVVVAATWAVLLPAKFWPTRTKDSWSRRLAMLILGAVVGLTAVWVDGWPVGLLPAGTGAEANGDTVLTALVPTNLLPVASYLSYYAMAFFALRWWRLADPQRRHRFSFGPLLAAGFWSVLLLFVVWPQPISGIVVLVMAAVIVQLVSPWEGPPPSPPRKLRLRYA